MLLDKLMGMTERKPQFESQKQWDNDRDRLIETTLGRMHYCDLCGVRFVTQRRMIAGSPVHRDDGEYLEVPFACPECGRKTLVSSQLKRDW